MDYSILLAAGMIVAHHEGGLGQKRSDDTPYMGDFYWAGSDCGNILVRLAGAIVVGALLLGVFAVL